MKRIKLSIALLIISISLLAQESETFKRSMQFLQKPTKDYVFVTAHRGDWRNFPENSLGALESCIRLGVNAMETDLAETKDGVIVIMHDETVDRTTSGKGAVKDLTLEEIKKLRLKDGLGRRTRYTVPTLKEMLQKAKGKLILDLDIKASSNFDKIMKEVIEAGMEKQIIVRPYLRYADAVGYYGKYIKEINYIPSIGSRVTNIGEYIREFEKEINPKAYTFVFDDDKSAIVQYMDTVKANHDALWVHVITANRSGNHNDDRAVKDPEGAYGWLINKGVRMMLTDRPELLIKYLKSKGLR